MTDTPENQNVVSLGDHRQPVHYRVGILHHWDGRIQTYVADADLSNPNNRATIADTLEGLVAKLRSDDAGGMTPRPLSEMPK